MSGGLIGGLINIACAAINLPGALAGYAYSWVGLGFCLGLAVACFTIAYFDARERRA